MPLSLRIASKKLVWLWVNDCPASSQCRALGLEAFLQPMGREKGGARGLSSAVTLVLSISSCTFCTTEDTPAPQKAPGIIFWRVSYL